MIVRSAIRQYNEQPGTRILLREFGRSMSDGSAEAGVVLVIDAADTLLYFIGILFIEILYNIKLYIAPSFGSESVDRVNITHRFQRFAHQDQPFLFNFDDP